MKLSEKIFFYYCAFISLILTLTAGFPMAILLLPVSLYFGLLIQERLKTKNTSTYTKAKLLNGKKRLYISLIIFALLLGMGVANVLRNLI